MFFIFANRVFAPMIERILLIQQGSSWGGVLSVRVLLIDDRKAVVHELRSLLSLNEGGLCVGELKPFRRRDPCVLISFSWTSPCLK